MLISELERSLDSLRSWLIFWTLMVAVGLVVEYGSAVKNFALSLAKKLLRHHASSWPILSATIIGGILITTGVIGEFWIEFRSSHVETDLRNENHRALANLENETAQAERETIRLLAEIQPRYLTPGQENSIANQMRSFSGRGVLIGSHWVDAEAAQLARQIKSALNRAGIGRGKDSIHTTTVDKIGQYPEIITGLFGGGGVPKIGNHVGIEIWGTDRPAVKALAASLAFIGGVSTPAWSRDVPFAELSRIMPLSVFVGSKPIPAQPDQTRHSSELH